MIVCILESLELLKTFEEDTVPIGLKLLSTIKFSKIFKALSDSNRLSIFAIDSVDKSMKISDCIDSLSSINISGSKLKPSSSIS